MLNIKQLQKDVEDRQRKVIGNYDAILQQCYNKIMATNQKINDCYCFFSCPTFVFGVPLYNVNSCITYIMEKLILKGFEVKYTHPNLIYISWKNGLNPPVYQNADPNALNPDNSSINNIINGNTSSSYAPITYAYNDTQLVYQTPMKKHMTQLVYPEQNHQSYNTWQTPVMNNPNLPNPLHMMNKNNSTQQQSYRPISDIYTDGSLFN